jgi:hypothetical protein
MRYYDIEGTINTSQDEQYNNPSIIPCLDFYEKLELFKKTITQEVENKESKTYIHFGDGDYYFLTKQPIGSAMPGKRALSIPYSQLDVTPYVNGFIQNDYICIELISQCRNGFNSIYPNCKIDINTEYLYALVCNKWFTKTFSGRIGLIGAEPKLKIVKELLQHKQYQDYLGLDDFVDYIYIPQKFACDDIDKTEQMVAEQLKNSKSDIFLFGVGHVKSALVHRMKKYKSAVYVDVGAGIDCYAGMIDPERPYAYGWTNYRLNNYNYNEIDYLRYQSRPTDIIL